MSVNRRFFSCFSLLLLAGINAFGQAAKSPFSTFGIGERYGNALAHNQGMGGLGLSQPQYWYLNNQNPALLVYNSFTVFQVGLMGEQLDLSNGTKTEQVRGGTMNSLALAFPLKFQKITTSIGLAPYTNVNYRLQYDYFIENEASIVTDTAQIQERGNGGLAQLYWSTGFKINKNLALGIKASYLFGSVDNDMVQQISPDGQVVSFVTGISESTYSRGFNLGGGISYTIDSLLNGEYRLSLGAIYDFATRASSSLEKNFYSVNSISGDTVALAVLDSKKGKLELPLGFGGGISFAKDRKWAIGVDYYYQDWSTFRSLNQAETNADNLGASWRLSLGGEYTPDYISLNFFKRVTYRVGLSQAPFFANGKEVDDFGINFGMSLPSGRSSIDLAFKAGQRGAIAENGLKENYFKVYLGVTLNDQWFIKRKFD